MRIKRAKRGRGQREREREEGLGVGRERRSWRRNDDEKLWYDIYTKTG